MLPHGLPPESVNAMAEVHLYIQHIYSAGIKRLDISFSKYRLLSYYTFIIKIVTYKNLIVQNAVA